MNYFLIFPKSLLTILSLYLTTKLIGKKQAAELSIFDYVIGISIGNFAAEMVVNKDVSFIYGVGAIFSFGVISYIVSIITLKSIKLRKYLIGTPTIIIQNGELLINNLRKVKMDINDMMEQLRIGGYFNIEEIEYGIIEANGTLSIMPKAEYAPLTPNDMNIKVSKKDLIANIIIDSEIIEESLEYMKKNKEWLIHELLVKGYKNTEDILLATLDINNNLKIYKKNSDLKAKRILE